MTDEVNTTIVRRYIEEWANEGNEAALHDVIAPDWVSHGTQSATATPTGLPSGIAGAKQLHDEVRAIWIFRLANGKIAEVWRCADDLGRVVQIGGTIVPRDDERRSGAASS